MLKQVTCTNSVHAGTLVGIAVVIEHHAKLMLQIVVKRVETLLTLMLQLVAKRVETLLTFEANFRHLDNYNIYPLYPPLISVVCIGDQIKNLGEQH